MLEFVPYTRDRISSVQAFNDRMVAGGLEAELRFPEQDCFDSTDDNGRLREYFVAVEDAHVRGAYFLTYESWRSGEQFHRVANFRLPLSEGFVDPNHKGIGRALLRHALERNELLYCLGLGSKTRPLPHMLAGEKWTIADTAFYFRCAHPRAVLRELAWLRAHRGWRIALDAAALAGGGVSIIALQRFRTQAPPVKFKAKLAADFATWADDLWDGARGDYSMLADRSCGSLRARYPASHRRFQRLLVRVDSEIRGWAVVLATDMCDHRHFGNLRVGTIVDCLAVPGSEHGVICATADFLDSLAVDLIVSNQSHRTWRSAFERAGFLSGPTNRFFTPSPGLSKLLAPFEEKFPLTHLTRGDGAGPIHL
jgi:GNAT superfamily N-acetyltransferase